MNTRDVKIGMTLGWNDPAEDPNTNEDAPLWKVVAVLFDEETWGDMMGHSDDDLDDVIIRLTNDAGGELEAYALELEYPLTSPDFTGQTIQFPSKPHQKMPLPTGTQHEEGGVVT